MSGGLSYEELHGCVTGLRIAQRAAARDVRWLTPGHQLGVSRDEAGRLEIFLSGHALSSTSRVLQAHLVHDRWRTGDGQELTANRLRLPSAPHFDAVAAFLLRHLVECGVLDDLDGAFRRATPVLELAFEEARLRGEVLAGLVGELLVLRSMLDRRPEMIELLMRSWHGSTRSARDLQVGSVGVEVKTTRGEVSRHDVQGIHQVEVGHGVGGVAETALVLVSVGLVPAEEGDETRYTLPELVEAVLDRVRRQLRPEDRERVGGEFLESVAAYGSGWGEAYDHESMRDRLLYSQPWTVRFVRAYDMADDLVHVLTTSRMVGVDHVDPGSVRFSVVFPAQVRGDINPVVGLRASTERILRLGGL